MNAPESRRWQNYARSDLDAARALLSDPEHFPRQVCFLAQQSAEKSLKAILVLLEMDFPFTHDLDRLRDLIPDDWEVKNKYPELAELTIWAVETRYPGDSPDVLTSDAQHAIEIAAALYQTVAEELQNHL